jgi:hypothetical protein
MHHAIAKCLAVATLGAASLAAGAQTYLHSISIPAQHYLDDPHIGALAVDPSANRVYAQLAASGASESLLVVVDGATDKAVQYIPLPVQQGFVAVDGARRLIYVSGCFFVAAQGCGVAVVDGDSIKW